MLVHKSGIEAKLQILHNTTPGITRNKGFGKRNRSVAKH